MRGNLAGLYDELGNYEEAEQLLLVNYESLRENKRDGAPQTIEHLRKLIDFYNMSEQIQKKGSITQQFLRTTVMSNDLCFII